MIEVLGISVLVNMFVHWFQPLQWAKEKLGWHKLPEMFMFLNCTKCLGLWTGLVVTQDLFQAAVISLTSYLVDNLIWFIEERK